MVTVSINHELLSVSEAADILGCTMRNIRKLVSSGIVKGVRLHDRALVVYRSSVEAYKKKPQHKGRPRLGFQTDKKKTSKAG